MTRDRCRRGSTHSSLTIWMLDMVHLPSPKRKIEIGPLALILLILILVASFASMIFFSYTLYMAGTAEGGIVVRANDHGEFVYEFILAVFVLVGAFSSIIYLMNLGCNYLRDMEQRDWEKSQRRLYAFSLIMTIILLLIVIKVMI